MIEPSEKTRKVGLQRIPDKDYVPGKSIRHERGSLADDE
jgi:hypothetical protein